MDEKIRTGENSSAPYTDTMIKKQTSFSYMKRILLLLLLILPALSLSAQKKSNVTGRVLDSESA